MKKRVSVHMSACAGFLTPYLSATAAQSSSTQEGSNMVILNDIHIDIMDYITPAHCTLLQFRYGCMCVCV